MKNVVLNILKNYNLHNYLPISPDVKLVTTERRRNYLVSESSYHTKKTFIENLLAMEMRKIQILMNKAVYLDLSVLDLSKTVMYNFWYDYVKPKCGENASKNLTLQILN